jgi:hypothetical protein
LSSCLAEGNCDLEETLGIQRLNQIESQTEIKHSKKMETKTIEQAVAALKEYKYEDAI